MSLLVYECQRADHGHEIRQFGEVARQLRKYYDDRKELALLVGNVNIGKINLDGLIIKNDALIILELKDRSGEVVARINGEWTCDNEIVRGGSNKTVFEQLKVNRRELRTMLEATRVFSKAQTSDIQGLVVFAELKKYVNELDRDAKQWVHAADVLSVGGAMHDIKARQYFDFTTREHVDPTFNKEAICAFIRGMKLPESALVTDLSDTNQLPSDLFHKDAPHNGKSFSTEAQLADKSAEVESLKAQLADLQMKLDIRDLDHEKELNERQAQINRQKEELLAAKEQHILDEKTAMEEMLKSETAEQENRAIREKLALIEKETAVLAAEKDALQKQIADLSAGGTAEPGQVVRLKAEIQRLTDLVKLGRASVPVESSALGGVASPFVKKPRVQHEKEWDVPEGSMDDDQLDLIDQTLDQSMLVAGCAGSGKSVIAMKKAVQIKNAGGDVILIALTKSLNRYMGCGNETQELGARFFYHYQWVKAGKPSADYVIVDEIQDFTEVQIREFIKAANKSYFFFGDTAQSIYRCFGVNTLTIDQVADLTALKPLYLYNNYRLPRAVAKITQPYVAVGATEYNERVYQSNERAIPCIVQCTTFEDQVRVILDVVARKDLKNIGVFMPSNDGVLRIYEAFTNRGIPCEYKYSKKGDQEQWRDTLDFRSNLPKIMTYHSAKGLQFEAVFLPAYEGADNDEDRKALYVAMTRTWRHLYVLYSGELKAPLNAVPPNLYLKDALS